MPYKYEPFKSDGTSLKNRYLLHELSEKNLMDRIAICESLLIEQIGVFFETFGDWGREMGYLQQHYQEVVTM